MTLPRILIQESASPKPCGSTGLGGGVGATTEHRLVYRVNNGLILVALCRGHY
ncbi:MAG: hypothetical protein Q8O37_17445 [Sulfuricellaceae bacterium]|nr:hypothetical protein [Sulfuricellaceae bacterium]